MKKEHDEFQVRILQVEALHLIGLQLLGIREELHQANTLTIEKQKANLNGILTKAEKDLIRGAI